MIQILSPGLARLDLLDDGVVGIDDDGPVGVIDDHAGLGSGGALELLDGGHVHADVPAQPQLGVVRRQLGGLGDGVVGDGAPICCDDDVGAVDLLGMEPDVALACQLEGQLVVLPVVQPT